MRIRTVLLTLVMCFAGLTLCFGESPMMGTWKLNEAKSKMTAGSSKNVTVVYETAGDSIKCSIDGVDGQGKDYHSEWTGKFDGKDYPLTGDPAGDARSYKKISALGDGRYKKKDGKAAGISRIVVAADGKSRTVTTTLAGKKKHSVYFYDKQ